MPAILYFSYIICRVECIVYSVEHVKHGVHLYFVIRISTTLSLASSWTLNQKGKTMQGGEWEKRKVKKSKVNKEKIYEVHGLMGNILS